MNNPRAALTGLIVAGAAWYGAPAWLQPWPTDLTTLHGTVQLPAGDNKIYKQGPTTYKVDPLPQGSNLTGQMRVSVRPNSAELTNNINPIGPFQQTTVPIQLDSTGYLLVCVEGGKCSEPTNRWYCTTVGKQLFCHNNRE
jgi:hypothetical protein